MLDIPLYESVMKSIDEFTGMEGHNQPRYKQYPYPQRLSVLSDTVKIHTLREHGNIGRYLEAQAEIFALAPSQARKQDKTLYSIIQWLNTQMKAINPRPPENAVVISLLVFGKEYIDKMLNYTFKSLMAFENLPCLVVEKRVIIYLQTDAGGQSRIEKAPVTLAIKALGVHFEYAIIPDEIIAKLGGDEMTYWMLGACASLALHYAKSLGAAFHHSYPDIVYSNKFFSELLRLSKGNKSILGPGMRSDESLLIPMLKKYCKAAAISIPAADLMAHHMNCLHMVAFPYVVNHRPVNWYYPQNHVLLWESETHMHFNSPHVNAWWLDYSVIKDLPARYYQTLDSELDLICKGEDFYMPDGGDDLYQAELSPADRASIRDMYGDVGTCARTIWAAVSSRDTVKFFIRGMKVPINREIRPEQPGCFPEAQIRAEKNFLFNTMMASDPHTRVDAKRKRAHAGSLFA